MLLQEKECVALCKGIEIPESGKFSLWNPGSWTLQSGIKKCRMMYLESGIQGVKSRIQDFSGKWWNLWDIKILIATIFDSAENLDLFNNVLLELWNM